MAGGRRVGLAYSTSFLAHDTGAFHPERPGRLTAIVNALQKSGTWDRLDIWEPEPTDDTTLELVHTPAHVGAIRDFIQRGGGHIDADTVASAASWDAASRAVGATIEAADRVSQGSLDAALCLVRPPGHHATPHQAMGFCLFNNVAIAAAWLLATGRAHRVAILDYDVHHGNGTQDAFDERKDVLYVSTHQYPLYPGTGHWRDTGVDAGRGYTINLSVPPGSGDAIYEVLIDAVIEPAFKRYEPDFVFVSLGFDAFWRDPLAQLQLSIGRGYVPLLRSAIQLAQGRLVIALEGGYDLEALAAGGDAACRLLLGDDSADDPIGVAPDQLSVEAVDSLVREFRTLHGL